MCFFCNDSKKVGILFKRDDFLYSNIEELRVVFRIQLLEIDILRHTIQAVFLNKYKLFDAVVGDCKCQVRVSMLLDITNDIFFKKKLVQIEEQLFLLKEKIENFIIKVEKNNLVEIKKIINESRGFKISNFLEKNNLNYQILHELFFLGLSFFTSIYSPNSILNINESMISDKKYISLLKLAKKKLSLLSIQYEQDLAKKYSDLDIQKVLNVIEHKGFCSMTAFYPSFIPIWNKIKQKKELILKKTIFFCDCGGVKDIQSELFRANKNNILEIIEVKNLNEVAFLIEGYKFKGSFFELNKLTPLSLRQSITMTGEFKPCICSKPLEVPKIENIEDVILASFVQHDQFTNKAEIDWASLGLENSELKKEYDRLNKIPGCSLDDMSVFRIIHIYASTVGQELEDQRQLLIKLGKK